ncbi:MAG: molecular chaperone HtpG [Bacteroidota bacterium]|nr:molecular chaperone HtpG [Bacteroidota bacterium]
MKQGKLSVETQDIFPLIKKFLYTDQEIFLRELISNATDAIQKLNVYASKGEYEDEVGKPKIEIKLDEKQKTLTVIDNGIGMTAKEIEEYINKIAFSSAGEFLKKYEDKEGKNKLIGHFGLGFYSVFMVADKVEIITKSYKKDTEAAKWTCSGSIDYKITASQKKTRGTEIILHISDDANEYLKEFKINELLEKYAKFMPFEIFFGTETVKEKTGKKDKDGKDIEKDVEKPRVINNTNPIWTKLPKEIKEEEYKNFYSELYPMSQPPLFWIHLNVDYPFKLTGILYFPKVSSNMELQKNKIKLYSNQVYVTDTVDDIVPEFLTLLHGVIDSPDIPLNVSRSALQSDKNVKKISSYIIRKVSEKLQKLFKDDRKNYNEKWNDIGVFVKYGMLTDEKFYEKAEKFVLFKDVDDNYFTFDEYKKKTEVNQKDKDKKTIWLYTSDKEEQYSYIEQAKKKDYNVLEFNEVIDSHFINTLEQKLENIQIKRIDASSVDQLINKDEKKESVLGKKAQESLTEIYKEVINNDKVIVKTESLSPDEPPVVITEDEFMRRFSEMSKLGGGGMMGMGDMPTTYNIVVNTNHEFAKKIVDAKEKNDKTQIAKQLYDLARLSKNILKGKELTDFVGRSMKFI